MQASPAQPKPFSKSVNHPIYNHPSIELFFNSINVSTAPVLSFPYVDYITTEGDENSFATLSIKPYTKFIELGTREIPISAINTAEQIQDLNSTWNMDTEALLKSIVSNEHVQSLVKEGSTKAFEYGETNFKELNMPWDSSLEGNIRNIRKFKFSDGAWQWFLNMFRSKANKKTISELIPVDFNNVHTLQRKFATKIMALSNMIVMSGRRGPANTIVCSAKYATVLQDCSGFMMSNSGISVETNGVPYQIGSYVGMSVYVDPFMRWDDNRILVFRRGHESEPGLHLIYMDGYDEIETISEATMAPRISKRCRERVAEVGFKPHSNFIVATIDVPDGMI